MSLEPTPRDDERVHVLEAVARERAGVRNAAHGLSDDDARRTPTVSGLSVGGIIKHLTVNEEGWVAIISGAYDGGYDGAGDSFHVDDTEPLHDLLVRYDEATRATDALVATFDDLSQTIPVPESMRQYVSTDTWSMHWVVLQLLTETTRHAGHADIIRESIDGATSGTLKAAAEASS
jgi:uncharacterized damage-inducible protein DinB